MKVDLLKPTAFFYALMSLMFILHPSSLIAQRGNGVVKGIVQSDNNEPLTSVSVVIRNTKTNFKVAVWIV